MTCEFHKIPIKMTSGAVITFALILMSTTKISGDNSLEIERIIPAYAIANNFDHLEANSKCRRDLEIFKNSVDTQKVWSLRMLDASGVPKPGFIHGNGFWLGVETQCYDIMNPKPLDLHPEYLEAIALYRKPEEETAPYKLNYFSARFSHNSTVQYQHNIPLDGFITLGLCLPASCNTDELAMILQIISKERTLTISKMYNMDITLLNVRDLKSDYHFLINWRSITLGFIVIFTSIMIIIGTWYDLCIHQKQVEKKKSTASNNEDHEREEKQATENTVKKKNSEITVGSVFMCFSAYTNSKNIFDVSSDRGRTACLHGLRVISMFLLIGLHVSFYRLDYTDNMSRLIRLTELISMQLLSNGYFPVDTFFFMAGFLAAYVFFRDNMKNEKAHTTTGFQWGEFFKALTKRYFRLTPIFIVVMGVFEILGGYFAETSQFQRYEKPQEQCPKYWWRNLLYIHNFFHYDELCASWTWYLSDDMQFFIIATIVLLISTKHPRTAIGIVIALLLSSTIITGYTAYDFGYVPTIDQYIHTLSIVYYPPWTHIGPYLVGLATGYMIVNMKDEYKFSKRTIQLLWTVSIVSLLLVQFGLTEKRISVLAASIYVAVSRTVWSLAIAWIVTACSTNNAGIVNQILAWKLWSPLSKLTYAAYLLNPIVISTVSSLDESAIHLNILSMGISWVGYFVVTYIFAYVMSVMFEMPYMLLVKLFFDRRNCK